LNRSDRVVRDSGQSAEPSRKQEKHRLGVLGSVLAGWLCIAIPALGQDRQLEDAPWQFAENLFGLPQGLKAQINFQRLTRP
jgi:hypothetical protein